MKCFNIFPVDSAGTGCGTPNSLLSVDNIPGHAQPGLMATSGNKKRIFRFNTANTSGYDAGLLSFIEKTKQQTS